MNIPKEFKLFGDTIKVRFDNEACSTANNRGLSCYGYYDNITNEIILADTVNGVKLPENTIVSTFYHERTHVILQAMGEYKLYNNEKFVEVFSCLLRQSEVTNLM